MKKTTVLLSILAAVGFSTAAQAQVRFGVKGGVSLSNYSGLTDAEKKGVENLVNGNAGVMMNAPITDDGFFSIQPELLYSGKGIKFSDDGGVEATERLHYVDLPILGKINADGFVFEVGPQVGYMVGRKLEISSGGQTVTDKKMDNVNRFDFGYVAGVGYELESGLGFGIRYNGGLLKVDKEVAGLPQSDAKNSVFQFQVGYLFGGK